MTPELVFLRDMEHRLSWLVWAKSRDGATNRNRPRPTPLTAAERRAAKPEREKYDARPIAETLAFLGWAKN